MRSLYLVGGLTLVCYISLNAQTITSSGGGTGLWSDPASWSPATVLITGNSTAVTINSAHTITGSDTRSIDQLAVAGTLIINNGITLAIADGASTDPTVNVGGVITNNGTLNLNFDPPPPIANATAIINGTLNNSGTISNAADQLMLKASGAPDDGNRKSYLTEDATDAIAVETSSSFLTPSLTNTKTYFVSALNSLGCEGGRMAVTATITYPYDIVGVTNAQGCERTSMSLSASGAPSDGSYRWYASQAGTGPIPNQSADTFETPAPAYSITYDGTGSGLYNLVVTSGTCMTQVEKEFAVTGDINCDRLKGYLLYPNSPVGTIGIEVPALDPVLVSVKNQPGSEITAGDLKQEREMRNEERPVGYFRTYQWNFMVVIEHGEKTVVRNL